MSLLILIFVILVGNLNEHIGLKAITSAKSGSAAYLGPVFVNDDAPEIYSGDLDVVRIVVL